MSRKDAINSLFLKKPDASASPPPPERTVERVRSGAISAMGSSLHEMAEGMKAASKLHDQLAAGEIVVSLDPALIDGSLIADRLVIDNDPGFEALVDSIAQYGQQVPILVRPHPAVSGRFQVAYGRRRLRAVTRLRKPVKAIIRGLTDDELVIAQGRENLDRADLSFIEKALFARRLEDAGYARSTITTALSTDKADLSRYITTARIIPETLAAAIGPADKVGRARWQALGDAIEDVASRDAAERVIISDEFLSADSNGRFTLVLAAVISKPTRRSVRGKVWSTPQGRKAARVEASDGKTTLIFDDKFVPEFGAFIADRLDDLYLQFTEKGGATPRSK